MVEEKNKQNNLSNVIKKINRLAALLLVSGLFSIAILDRGDLIKYPLLEIIKNHPTISIGLVLFLTAFVLTVINKQKNQRK